MNKTILMAIGLMIGVTAMTEAEPAPGGLTRLPTAGVAFGEPAGWIKMPRDKGKTIGWWISPGSTPRNPQALIRIDCGLGKTNSLEDLANGVAKDFGGRVSDAPTTLGGTRALRIRTEGDGRSLRPVEWIVTIHGGLTYMLIGGVVPGQSVEKPIEAIRASWTWIPIEPMYKHLEFHDKPQPIFGGVASMNYPALMFAHPTDQPDRVLDLELHSVARNKSEFLAYVQLVPIAEGQTFETLKEKFAGDMSKKFKMKAPFAWRVRGTDQRRVISPTIDFEPPPEAKSPIPTVPVKFALVKLDDRQIVLLNFTLVIGSPQENAAYEAVLDRIVDSVELNEEMKKRTNPPK